MIVCGFIHFHFQYENESRLIAGPWSSNLLSGVPHWSDAKGKVSLPQEVFVPPEGWRWDGAWELSPEIRYMGYWKLWKEGVEGGAKHHEVQMQIPNGNGRCPDYNFVFEILINAHFSSLYPYSLIHDGMQ